MQLKDIWVSCYRHHGTPHPTADKQHYLWEINKMWIWCHCSGERAQEDCHELGHDMKTGTVIFQKIILGFMSLLLNKASCTVKTRCNRWTDSSLMHLSKKLQAHCGLPSSLLAKSSSTPAYLSSVININLRLGKIKNGDLTHLCLLLKKLLYRGIILTLNIAFIQNCNTTKRETSFYI